MCGIAGIINFTPKEFDYSSFCILGVNNDSRGGDSCGIFIDGQVEYGVDKKKLFSDFYKDSNILKSTQYADVALLHCRKASVGGISESKAQPVVIKDDQGKIVFVVLHNGTIHNYEDLAKKYIPEIDIKDMTDSQIMARIFFYKGYDALGEYEGGSVFFIADYRKDEPEFYAFKGRSKKADYKTAEETDERPFYFVGDKDELMFSSIQTFLPILRKDYIVYTIEPNCLIKFKNGDEIEKVKQYDRSERCQAKKYKTVYNPSRFSMDYDYGYYYNSGISTSACVHYDMKTCRYQIGDVNIHGRRYVSTYGYSSITPNTSCKHEIWFYEGIALAGGEKYFESLDTIRKKLRLESKEFSNKFENMIRFYSLDRVFRVDGVMMEAVSPTARTPYSGPHYIIGNTYHDVYSKGKLPASIVKTKGSYENAFKKLKKFSSISKINKLYKKCLSLMK